MTDCFVRSIISVGILFFVFNVSYSLGVSQNGINVKSATFFSPKFELGPGSVENRLYFNIDFPRGHIAVKSFNGEVIDESGNPIPLHETYLHHWVVDRYYQRKKSSSIAQKNRTSDHISARNSGICQGGVLGQYFGLGSETRKTATDIPDPYGIEIGNPEEIPEGFEERWMLNVHAIDTRGVEDRLGCTECKCDLYNVTVDEYGDPLRPDYKGGLLCCYDHTQCKLRKGFQGTRRILYLKYTVKWVDLEPESSIIPVKIFILDVTDDGKRYNGSVGDHIHYGCRVEYDVEPCRGKEIAAGDCVDAKRTSVVMPNGGYVVYGVAHQHTGGIGSTLYGQDERLICKSVPTYGEGKEAGNEAGYIVGMSTCYPKPGTVKISDGEVLTLESNYSKSTRGHTGVMGLFYLLVAEELPNPVQISHTTHLRINEEPKASTFSWAVGIAGVLGVAATITMAARYFQKKRAEDGYQPILT